MLVVEVEVVQEPLERVGLVVEEMQGLLVAG
jgi:hypothetical protein